ncbi:Bax inhibitor-1/YccA family protein [Lentilactobacillus sp. Marseille-Q4993]|uniref:Bax inhibitor-1/YccA family protein n=1 Tax=Lentilactobacillus sp. Marseille-Q4993 TaxID=3039492 RepID=UPI0024BC082A|nr:Bax inhibitor-1/YccA family protein [Lentilactobacillus sp. Marseille-Q4993]
MNNYPNEQSARKVVNDVAGLNSFLTKMYGWMTLAVLVSAGVAYFTITAGNGLFVQSVLQNPLLYWGSFIVWFIVPFVVTFQALKRPTASFVMLMLYAALTGFVFSTIVIRYTGAQVTAAFLSAAIVFITMAIIGITTKRNMDKIGTHATAALIGLIVAMVINMFLHSSAITFFLSAAAVIIFSILTAYDSAKMKQLYMQNSGELSITGLAVFGAMQLYLDFVNLFLQLLQLFGFSDNN